MLVKQLFKRILLNKHGHSEEYVLVWVAVACAVTLVYSFNLVLGVICTIFAVLGLWIYMKSVIRRRREETERWCEQQRKEGWVELELKRSIWAKRVDVEEARRIEKERAAEYGDLPGGDEAMNKRLLEIIKLNGKNYMIKCADRVLYIGDR